MTEEKKVLIQLLLVLGMTEQYTRAVVGTLDQEQTKKMLLFLKHKRPDDEQQISKEVIRLIELNRLKK